MSFSEIELLQLKANIARGKKKHEINPNSQIPDTQPKRNETAALGAAISNPKEGVQRITVRFIGSRVRPLDPDNFAGSVKDLLDGLRHAGLIHGDEPWRIKLETEQIQVKHFKDEQTLIEIEFP